MAKTNESNRFPPGTAAFLIGLVPVSLGLFWFFGLGTYRHVFASMPQVLHCFDCGLVYEQIPDFRADFGSHAAQVCWGLNALFAGLAAGFIAKLFWLIFCVPPQADLLEEAHYEQEHRSLPSPSVNHLIPLLRSCPRYDGARIQRDMYLGRIPLLTPGTDRPSTEFD